MSYTWYEVFWFFLLYSFAGWVIGTSGAALKEKKFIDVGFLFGPWCPSYGFGAVGFALFLPELKDQPLLELPASDSYFMCNLSTFSLPH